MSNHYKHRKLYFVFALISGFLVCIAIIFRIFAPQKLQQIKEGSLIENLTAANFFVSSLIGVAGIVKSRRQWLMNRNGYVTLLGIVLVLDEIGFGPLVVSLPYLGDLEIDGLHDLLDFAYRLYKINHPGFALSGSLKVL